MRFLKWFYPGMQVKRWLGLAVLGIHLQALQEALLETGPKPSGVRA